jgi:hypothetical protein
LKYEKGDVYYLPVKGGGKILVGGDETEYFGDVYHLNWVVGTH